GDADALVKDVHRAVKVDAVETAGVGGDRCLAHVGGEVVHHNAVPEAALAVAFAVVGAVLRLLLLGLREALGLAGLWVEEIDAGVGGDDEAALGADGDRRHHLLRPPFLVLAAPGVPAVDELAGDVRPVERLFAGVPARPLAQPAPRLQHAFDLGHALPRRFAACESPPAGRGSSRTLRYHVRPGRLFPPQALA